MLFLFIFTLGGFSKPWNNLNDIFIKIHIFHDDIHFINDIQFHTDKHRFLPQGSFYIKTRWAVLWGS